MKSILLAAISLAAAHPVHADLPMMKEKPWIGYFLGYNDKTARFGINSKGDALLEPLKKGGSAIMARPINISFDIFETLPDGKTVRKVIDANAFTSDSPAVLDPKKPVTIRGKVNGDATFEITISEDQGAISLSGRITDKGTLKNPLHLELSFKFYPYRYHGGTENPKQKEAFERIAEHDEIRLELPKGERAKLAFLDTMNPAEKAKDGFTSAEIRSAGYGGLRWNLAASPKSTLHFEDTAERPLWNNFTVKWTVNEGADPAAEKFTIDHK